MANTDFIDGLSRVLASHTTPVTFGQLFINASKEDVNSALISAAQAASGFADIVAKEMPIIKIAGKNIPVVGTLVASLGISNDITNCINNVRNDNAPGCGL